MNGLYTFGKAEKLKSRKQIEQLFAKGKAIAAHPLRIIYLAPEIPMDVPVKTGVTASSRHFKHAVDRNRIKRLLRETYRLNKHALWQHLQHHNRQLTMFILYTDKSLPDFETVNHKMQEILEKLIKATSEADTKNI